MFFCCSEGWKISYWYSMIIFSLYSISDLLFQSVPIKNKEKFSLKGGMTWIPATLSLIYCILYYTALYYILSLSMTSISEFLPSTWELRFLSTSSLLSLLLEVLGTESGTFHARQMLYPRAASQPFCLCSTSGPGMGCTLWAVLPFSLCHFTSPVHSLAVLRRWISVCSRLLCLSPLPQPFISAL